LLFVLLLLLLLGGVGRGVGGGNALHSNVLHSNVYDDAANSASVGVICGGGRPCKNNSLQCLLRLAKS
jgi:hypothetical protein